MKNHSFADNTKNISILFHVIIIIMQSQRRFCKIYEIAEQVIFIGKEEGENYIHFP